MSRKIKFWLVDVPHKRFESRLSRSGKKLVRLDRTAEYFARNVVGIGRVTRFAFIRPKNKDDTGVVSPVGFGRSDGRIPGDVAHSGPSSDEVACRALLDFADAASAIPTAAHTLVNLRKCNDDTDSRQ